MEIKQVQSVSLPVSVDASAHTGHPSIYLGPLPAFDIFARVLDKFSTLLGKTVAGRRRREYIGL
jgi:hypothetical protein